MRLLSNTDIDRQKWDACIDASINSKPYGLSSWLDSVAPNWKGYVIGDYKAVMPIYSKRLLWINKVVQPLFTQQLGMFISDSDGLHYLSEIIQQLQTSFSSGYMQLNEANFIEDSPINLRERRNYKLDYGKMDLSAFSKSHLRNLKKARKAELHLTKVDIQSFVNGYKEHNPVYRSQIRRHNQTLLKLLGNTSKMGIGQAIGVSNGSDILAAVWFIIYKKTAYYMLPYTSEMGRDLGAMHLMLTELPSLYPQVEILDFEGSELQGVERFILGFDAKLHPYPVLEW
jgi:hypothetical protein